jgi:hypothetical protein
LADGWNFLESFFDPRHHARRQATDVFEEEVFDVHDAPIQFRHCEGDSLKQSPRAEEIASSGRTPLSQ